MKIINSIFKTFLVALLLAAQVHFAYAQSAALLPVAPQQFFDKNGNPVSSGSVGYYIPGTSTPKMVWQDDSQTTPWTNPITLNAGGWPPNNKGIYGNGNYRQIIKDKYNNIISDQPTSATGTGGGSGTSVGDGNSVGTILAWSGMLAPNQYQFAYGQALSRATFPELLQAITQLSNITCVGGNQTLTGIGDTSNIPIGAAIEANCVVAGSTVLSKTLNTVTISIAASISTTASGRFFPYGNGNGTTTFNVPDLRGRVIPGRNNMGGIVSSNLTSTYYGSEPDAVGAAGGNQSSTLAQSNLPNVNFNVSIPSGQGAHTHSYTLTSGVNQTLQPGGANIPAVSNSASNTGSSTLPSMTGTAASGGSGTAFSLVQPSMTLNYIIKVTPDTSVSGLFGVASIGGMQGIITCGTAVVCAGNDISVVIPNQTTDSVNYTAPYIGSVVQSQTNYNKQRVSVTDFGAVCNNSTDDTTAIQIAVNAVAASNNKELYFPAGGCVISNDITVSSPIVFVGEGSRVSWIRQTNATASGVRWIGPMRGGGIRHLTVQAGAGFVGSNFSGVGSVGVGVLLTDVYFFNADDFAIYNFDFGLVKNATPLNGGSWTNKFTNFDIRFFSGDGIQIDPTSTFAGANIGGDNFFSKFVISNVGFTGSATGSTCLHIFASGGDMYDTGDISSCAIGVNHTSMIGSSIVAGKFSNIYSDTNIDAAWVFDGTNGLIYDFDCNSCWGSYTTNGPGLITRGAGLTNFKWNGGELLENGTNGWHHEGGSNVYVRSASIARNSKLLTNTSAGVLIDANVSSWGVQGSIIGNFGPTVAWEQAEGISIAAGTSNDFTVTGNDLSNPGTGKVGFANGSTGTRTQVSLNLPISQNGMLPTTIASAATIDLGATSAQEIKVSGSTGPITSFGGSAGLSDVRQVTFLNTPTLTYNATSMILPGAANITAAAGDTLIAVHEGSGNWRVVSYFRASGQPVFTIDAAHGGTGQTSYTAGDLLQATGATTLSKLAAVATGNALISGGVGTASSWGKIGLSTHVSGTLPVGNGGTGLAAGTSGGIPYFNSTSTMASSGALTAGAIMLGGGAGSPPTTGTCTEDANGSIVCLSSTAFNPSPQFINNTNDANAAALGFGKRRAGGNVSAFDTLGAMNFTGFANGGDRVSVQIKAITVAASSGSNIPSTLLFSTSNAAGQVNQQFAFNSNAHLGVTAQVTAAAVSSCGTSPSISGAKDNHGTVSVGTGSPTACTITFGTAYASTPDCVVTSYPQLAAFTAVVSTSSIVVTQTATSSNKISYICLGQ